MLEVHKTTLKSDDSLEGLIGPRRAFMLMVTVFVARVYRLYSGKKKNSIEGKFRIHQA